MNLYIDIETIPTQLEWVKEKIREEIKPPGNIKKQESIDKWMAENSEKKSNEEIHKTGFDGSIGEIICISFAIDDGEIINVGRLMGESEAKLLDKFYAILAENGLNKYVPIWIGHYICEFDLRFLWQRTVINKANTKGISVPKDSKAWGSNVFDTYYEWSGSKSKGFGSLDLLCKIFGIEGKGDIDGSKVWEYVQAGREKEVFEYCNDDVDKVRQIYKLMENN